MSPTTNNCSASLTITVDGDSPDLVVLGPGVGSGSRDAAEMFRLLVTVHNLGAGESAATTVKFYRSTDAMITTSDTLEGTGAVNMLVPGAGSGNDLADGAVDPPPLSEVGNLLPAQPGCNTTNYFIDCGTQPGGDTIWPSILLWYSGIGGHRPFRERSLWPTACRQPGSSATATASRTVATRVGLLELFDRRCMMGPPLSSGGDRLDSGRERR